MTTAKTSAGKAKKPDPSKGSGLPFTVLQSGADKQFDVIVPSAEITIRQIQDAIPSKYFKRDMAKGFYFVARDLVQSVIAAAVMYYGGYALFDAVDAATGADSLVSFVVRFVVWNAFWFVQGLSWTGLWVMAHECGHQSFSNSTTVNDAVGFVLHSSLLVPYHAWRVSHGTHHKHTNHTKKDTVFIPNHLDAVREATSTSPIGGFLQVIMMLTVGWPAYLIGNVAGQDYGRRTSHFEPSSPLFQDKDFGGVVAGDLGVFGMLVVLGFATAEWGFGNVFCWYVVPYLWTNAWLVLITYLQHSDIRIPHYAPENWNFVRGALCTVDRDFGPLVNWWLHHINDSHLIHHLFSRMPFYHAIEVTRHHNKEIFGDLHQTDSRPIATALWESWRECLYIVKSEGISIYRK